MTQLPTVAAAATTTATTTIASSSFILTDSDLTDDELKEFFYLDPPLPSTQSRTSTTAENEESTPVIDLTKETDSDYLSKRLEVPDYLRPSSASYESFEKMLQTIVSSTARTIDREELRQIALLMHQVHVLDLEKWLWNAYLKAGTGGLLPTDASNLKVWPSEVETVMRSARHAMSLTGPHLERTDVNDHDCHRFVHEQLRVFEDKQQQLRQLLIRKKKQSFGYRDPLDHALQTFVQGQIEPLHLQYQSKIKLVELNYRQEVLDQAWQQQNPTPQQMEFIKGLLARKHDYEKAKEEVRRMKDEVQGNRLPKALRSVQMPLPSPIQSLTNPEQREQLSARHHRVVQQYQSDMSLVLTEILATKLGESQKLFDDQMMKLWQNQRTLPIHERFTPAMLELLDRHLLLIAEKVQCMLEHQNPADIH